MPLLYFRLWFRPQHRSYAEQGSSCGYAPSTVRIGPTQVLYGTISSPGITGLAGLLDPDPAGCHVSSAYPLLFTIDHLNLE